MGRTHRPFFRVCAMDSRVPRDGKVIEELGYYDPMVADVDARAVLEGERIEHWLSVGAQPTEKVKVLIKKYGKDGTHLDLQRAALERLKSRPAPTLAPMPTPKPEPAAAAESDDAPAPEPAAETTSESAGSEGESAAEENQE